MYKAILIALLTILLTGCAVLFISVKEDKSVIASKEAIDTHNSLLFIAEVHSDALI